MNNGKLYGLIMIILLQTASCTHWLIETETRIQVKNDTDVEFHGLSIVSENGQIMVLVPDTLKAGGISNIYKNELAGKFNFAVFLGDSLVNLGTHNLKGGSVLAQIGVDGNEFTIMFK